MKYVIAVLLGAIGFVVLCLVVGAVRDSLGTWLIDRLRGKK